MSRSTTLLATCKAFYKTGIYLLTKTESGYRAIAPADDLGVCFYSTMLSYWLGFACHDAMNLLFAVLMGAFFLITAVCFWLIKPSFLNSIVIGLGLLRLAMPIAFLNPPYKAYVIVFLFVPLLLFAYKKRSKKLLFLISIVGGIVLSIGNSIRLYSALPVLLFYLIFLFGSSQWKRRVKSFSLGFFLLGYMIPYAHFHYALQKRAAFLQEKSIPQPNIKTHVFWHNIYTGLGYLNNDYGFKWTDACAVNAALKADPQVHYPSLEYEQVIKNEVLKTCKEKRYFVVTTIFAKLGVVFYYFLLYFGWLGFLASWFYPKPWYIELAFWVAMAISAAPGVLTIPVTAYLIGFITLVTLYTMYSVLWALNVRESGKGLL